MPSANPATARGEAPQCEQRVRAAGLSGSRAWVLDPWSWFLPPGPKSEVLGPGSWGRRWALSWGVPAEAAVFPETSNDLTDDPGKFEVWSLLGIACGDENQSQKCVKLTPNRGKYVENRQKRGSGTIPGARWGPKWSHRGAQAEKCPKKWLTTPLPGGPPGDKFRTFSQKHGVQNRSTFRKVFS